MNALQQWLGIELDEVSTKEKLISILGGAVSIIIIYAVSNHLLGLSGAPMLLTSMGASAVLLFAVPHGQLSQPWPVIGGHVASALIGVTCARFIPNVEVAAACAVGLSIGAMHQFKFIHPPGGATALTAVVGGEAITSLGYSFVWEPVLLNALVIVVVAVLFNAAFPWRRYPTFLTRRAIAATVGSHVDQESDEVTHQEILTALRSLDSFVDITEDDLLRLHRLLSTLPPTD